MSSTWRDLKQHRCGLQNDAEFTMDGSYEQRGNFQANINRIWHIYLGFERDNYLSRTQKEEKWLADLKTWHIEAKMTWVNSWITTEKIQWVIFKCQT